MAKKDKKEISFQYLGSDFERMLIATIISEPKFGLDIIGILSPSYFTTQFNRKLIDLIQSEFIKNEVISDFRILEVLIRAEFPGSSPSEEASKEAYLGFLDEIKKIEVINPEVIKENALNFCKQQKLQQVVHEIQEIIKTDNPSDYYKAEGLLKSALEVGNNRDDAIDVFSNFENVLEEDHREPIATGIFGLDEVMSGGLARGELGVIIAPLGTGKAQPLHSKILTPTGWTTMGEVKIGDLVISRDGKPTKVLGVYPQGERPIYKVSFNDGTSTLCDEEHLWAVNDINQRNRNSWKNGKRCKLPKDTTFKVRTTKEMIDKISFGKNNQLNFKVPVVSPIHFDSKKLLINPYVLGVLLGDGYLSESTINFTTKDDEIIDNIRNVFPNIIVKERCREIEKEEGDVLVLVEQCLKTVRLRGIKNELLELGLIGVKSDTKFIPKDYLYNSIENRVALLQGLIDTDGFIDKRGCNVQYTTVSSQLSKDVKELVMSLGGKCTISSKIGKYKKNGVIVECKRAFTLNISFSNNIIPTTLTRKIERYKARTKYSDNKFINKIEFVGYEEAQCIMVDNPEHLYVTDDYIVTHNTTITTKFANNAFNEGKKVLQIFFEDSNAQIQRKHIACWSGIDMNKLSENKDTVKEIVKIKKEEGSAKGGILKLKKMDNLNTKVSHIKQYIKKCIANGFRPDVVIIDYIDVINPDHVYKDTNEGQGVVMRTIENMCVEFNFVCWVAAQSNRSGIKAEVVEADAIGGSIKRAQIAHFIMSIARSLEQRDAGTANMAVLKSRFGGDGVIWTDVKFNNKNLDIDTSCSSGPLTHSMMKNGKNQEADTILKNYFDNKRNKLNTTEE